MIAGHDLDHVLSSYSFEQIGVLGVCAARARFGFVDALVSPLLQGLGSSDKGPAPTYRRGGPVTGAKPSPGPAIRDAGLLQRPNATLSDEELERKERAFLAKQARFVQTVIATTPGAGRAGRKTGGGGEGSPPGSSPG